jgi:D-alanyl-D-alanine dipeptidase
MNPTPRFAALLTVLLFCTQLITGGQGLFQRDAKTAIYRKAKKYNLVPLESAVPEAIVDLRYKITSAAGKPLYLTEMPALIHRATAAKLRKVADELKPHGYHLKIWDAWRPPEAHRALWDAVQDEHYVVPPSKGLSWHCYGISVDLTLARADGTEQHFMPCTHRGCVELATDDEIEAGLHAAFFDQMAAWLHGAEFAVAAEDIAILITEGFHDTKGWDLGSGEVCAHVLWGIMIF